MRHVKGRAGHVVELTRADLPDTFSYAVEAAFRLFLIESKSVQRIRGRKGDTLRVIDGARDLCKADWAGTPAILEPCLSELANVRRAIA